ncbi:hypothetical protein ABER61_28810 [Brevibacillus formosus]|uniref:Uncharacterized protein n=1 Tax=Brevibacillus formosus TaxID=54913 RepID=A0A837KLL6_9BACL|nr:hypothetical protein [Brevibacillus formosus]KLH98063.1 hypothetical protein AA984_13620 [Brevibacillus formosus]MED1960742.1 hypothetical protein [Brevibacillus formosus]PSJ87052.1 hypothetical protein C7R91_29075 [Brevibacillus formosus]GED61527.1 hypothetical protein BFO01nite_56590 [Brevibacillus formosus]
MYQDWRRSKGRFSVVLEAIYSLAAKGLLNDPEDWKKRLTDDPAGVLNELPWLMFTMLNRVTVINYPKNR